MQDDQFTHVAHVEELSDIDDARAKREAIAMVNTLVRITKEDIGGDMSVHRSLRIIAAALGYVMLSMEAQVREGNHPPCGSTCDPITLMNIAALPAMTYLYGRDSEGWERPGNDLTNIKAEGNA